MIDPPLIDLLDDRRLDGQIDVFRHLGPKFQAVLVERGNLDNCLGAIEDLCATWGGGCHRLYESPVGANVLPEELLADHARSQVDVVSGRGLLDESARGTSRAFSILPDAGAMGEPLLPVLVAAESRPEDWARIVAPTLAPDDPWRIAYAGVIGVLREQPLHPSAMQIFGLRNDVAWDDVCETTREHVAGSAEDLLRRLRSAPDTTPARFSCALLELYSAARNMGIAFPDPQLPTPHFERMLIGPNICVIYEPDSTADLTLLWNLRAAHGLAPGLPLGAPIEHAVEALAAWEHTARANFGLGGDRRSCLVSHSVPFDRLEELAESSEVWRAARCADVRQVGERPGRTGVDLVTFRDGTSHMASWTPDDRSALGQPFRRRQRDLVCTVAPNSRRLPPSLSLSPDWTFLPGCRDWGFRRDAGDAANLIEATWPSGWTVLQSCLADKGLTCRPSTAGRAAATFLTRTGSLGSLFMILNTPIMDELYRLATARSMSWFRQKLRDITRKEGGDDAESTLVRIERRLDDMRMRPPEADQPDVTFDQLRKVVTKDRGTLKVWLRWAERTGLFVRGINVHCTNCDLRSWVAIRDVPIPFICNGCGQEVEEPYPSDQIQFRYRASEPLLRLIEADSLVHLFAMRYLCSLWGPQFDRPASLYGAYPGVEILDGDTLIGEADVLLVLSDGAIVPGECKQRGAGLNDDEIAKLDLLSDRIGAPWSFLATADWAEDCPALWSDSVSRDADKWRIALTAEQLFDPFPTQLDGGWSALDTEARAAMSEQWTMYLPTVAESLASPGA